MSVKKKDNIQFCDYDREAEKRYENAKAFRIPKKTPTQHCDPTSNNAATVAVRDILSEMESISNTVTKEISVAQKNLPIEEENTSVEVEVTDVEIIVME